MLTLKPGTKLTSAACDTQVMVIKGSGEMDLRCGGAQMLSQGEEGSAELVAEFSGGTQIGKRYVDEQGSVELLCTKPGSGALSLGETVLGTKEAQVLPSSD